LKAKFGLVAGLREGAVTGINSCPATALFVVAHAVAFGFGQVVNALGLGNIGRAKTTLVFRWSKTWNSKVQPFYTHWPA
jgi:hypothetical protein